MHSWPEGLPPWFAHTLSLSLSFSPGHRLSLSLFPSLLHLCVWQAQVGGSVLLLALLQRVLVKGRRPLRLLQGLGAAGLGPCSPMPPLAPRSHPLAPRAAVQARRSAPASPPRDSPSRFPFSFGRASPPAAGSGSKLALGLGRAAALRWRSAASGRRSPAVDSSAQLTSHYAQTTGCDRLLALASSQNLVNLSPLSSTLSYHCSARAFPIFCMGLQSSSCWALSRSSLHCRSSL